MKILKGLEEYLDLHTLYECLLGGGVLLLLQNGQQIWGNLET